MQEDGDIFCSQWIMVCFLHPPTLIDPTDLWCQCMFQQHWAWFTLWVCYVSVSCFVNLKWQHRVRMACWVGLHPLWAWAVMHPWFICWFWCDIHIVCLFYTFVIVSAGFDFFLSTWDRLHLQNDFIWINQLGLFHCFHSSSNFIHHMAGQHLMSHWWLWSIWRVA